MNLDEQVQMYFVVLLEKMPVIDIRWSERFIEFQLYDIAPAFEK